MAWQLMGQELGIAIATAKLMWKVKSYLVDSNQRKFNKIFIGI